MAFDRDLNVAFVRAARRSGLRLTRGWEMLAATGVRGLRVIHEAGGFERFDHTELGPEAAEVLDRNVARYASLGARAQRADARLGAPRGPYDYVDLDPYGTPLPYLPAALAALSDDAVLAVTATDQRVLAGAERGVAERRYGGQPVRGRLGAEGGLRLLLALIAREGDRAGREARPLLSYVGDHHVRAYVRLTRLADRKAIQHVRSVDPATWTGPPLGARGPVGPLWMGPLLDGDVIARLEPDPAAQQPDTLARWAETLRGEVDVPFFYESNTLAHALRLPSPPSTAALLEALRASGSRAARSVVRAGAFRTSAPYPELATVARALGQSQNERVRA